MGWACPFPPLRERFERLEETLQICFQMWSDDNGPYEGRHYQLAETLCSPQPVSSPRPRVLIGGGGERKTLRLVATYADACNIIGDVETVTHKVEVLRRHCDDVGRDFAQIEVTALIGVADDAGPDAILERPRHCMPRASTRSSSVRPVRSRRSGSRRRGGRWCRDRPPSCEVQGVQSLEGFPLRIPGAIWVESQCGKGEMRGRGTTGVIRSATRWRGCAQCNGYPVRDGRTCPADTRA